MKMTANKFSLEGYMKLSGKNKLQKFQPDDFGTQIISSPIEGFFGFDNRNMIQVEFVAYIGGTKVKELVSGEVLNVILNTTSFPKFGGVCVLITVQKHPDYKGNFIPITRYVTDTLLKDGSYNKDKTFFVLMERDGSKNGSNHYYSFSSDPAFRGKVDRYMKDEGLYKSKEYKAFIKQSKVSNNVSI